MMVPLVGALALDQRGRRHLAGALWAVAVAVKWVPLLLLPLRTSVRQHGPRFGYAGFAAASLAVAVVASILYGDRWLGAFGPVGHDVASGSATSIPHLLAGTGIGKVLASGALVLAFVVAYAALVVVARSAARAPRPCDGSPVARDTVDSALVRELGGSTRRRRGRCCRPRALGGAHRLPARGTRAALTANGPHSPAPPPRRRRVPLLALVVRGRRSRRGRGDRELDDRGGTTAREHDRDRHERGASRQRGMRRRHGPSCSSSGKRGHWPPRCRTPRRCRSETAAMLLGGSDRGGRLARRCQGRHGEGRPRGRTVAHGGARRGGGADRRLRLRVRRGNGRGHAERRDRPCPGRRRFGSRRRALAVAELRPGGSGDPRHRVRGRRLHGYALAGHDRRLATRCPAARRRASAVCAPLCGRHRGGREARRGRRLARDRLGERRRAHVPARLGPCSANRQVAGRQRRMPQPRRSAVSPTSSAGAVPRSAHRPRGSWRSTRARGESGPRDC